ncbi:MAG: ComF family protein [Pseudomonadota bacterium]
MGAPTKTDETAPTRPRGARLSALMRRRLSAAAERTLRLLAPPLCPLTDAAVDEPHTISARAWSRLRFVTPPFCARCAVPFPYDPGAGAVCGACAADPPAVGTTRAALAYEGEAIELVTSLKYRDRLELAPLMGRWMAAAGRDLISSGSILAPVPLHPRRLADRRFNQAALLAAAVARETGAGQAPTALQRLRATPPQQSQVSADARRRNVQGAFSVRPGREADLVGAHVILIDDVYTTGATLSACARAARRAGAARVDALVLARVAAGDGRAL